MLIASRINQEQKKNLVYEQLKFPVTCKSAVGDFNWNLNIHLGYSSKQCTIKFPENSPHVCHIQSFLTVLGR